MGYTVESDYAALETYDKAGMDLARDLQIKNSRNYCWCCSWCPCCLEGDISTTGSSSSSTRPWYPFSSLCARGGDAAIDAEAFTINPGKGRYVEGTVRSYYKYK